MELHWSVLYKGYCCARVYRVIKRINITDLNGSAFKECCDSLRLHEDTTHRKSLKGVRSARKFLSHPLKLYKKHSNTNICIMHKKARGNNCVATNKI